MTTITDLPDRLAAHAQWVTDSTTGTRLVLRDADLTDADLTAADLTAAVLRGADLTAADLRSTCLRGADLRCADLADADLTGAVLRCADLTGADLTGADLRSADLTGADLRYADLRYADLTGADLRGADLRCAVLTGAVLAGADLERAVLPAGWLWWEGGASGPLRRRMRVWRPGPDAEIVAHQGCISGPVDEVREALTYRAIQWAQDHCSQPDADLWLAESMAMLDAGVAYINARATHERGGQ